ncbi:MAG: HepT-like ribonuclease domain-containing protein [Mobiluncus porci]|uniref:DUF86 domain-containing protein n=1 Tax=Mobiluncus porci TaxID=2652278 RepID=A0A7K0K5L7_9ACTO|nr:HepT-like ribonuclease domain-containing protein [Mobiluncus porci]MDD7541785.1 DUF86 domain-containing protein [Mobiluncus porci]MDY5748633.1 HepT-like ribonuclease domain-containing protein [Mobiluncus porci]MST50360.1 DUF86 domain-containing protein [Mobiluncus porci]
MKTPVQDEYYALHGFEKSNRTYKPEDTVRRLEEIQEQALDAEYIVSQGEEAFFADDDSGRRLRKLAERTIEILTESSRKIHSDFKETRPDVPWREIYQMRNVIAHAYGTADYEKLWFALKVDIPLLISKLQEDNP